jgi:hypothetical protein
VLNNLETSYFFKGEGGAEIEYKITVVTSDVTSAGTGKDLF